jgi:hypothetical protein
VRTAGGALLINERAYGGIESITQAGVHVGVLVELVVIAGLRVSDLLAVVREALGGALAVGDHLVA